MILPDPYPAASVAARRHAEIEWPREAIGYVIGNGEYVPLVNVHPDPENHVAISAEQEEEYRTEKVAVIHSHCLRTGEFHAADGPLGAGPSEHDMRQQIAHACPWGLVVVLDGHSQDTVIWWGDELGVVAPLLKRPFIHGVFDCYSIIRESYRTDAFGFVKDYFGMESVLLPEYPREFGWWSNRENGKEVKPKDIYREGFKLAGFAMIEQHQMRPGDVFLASINCHGVTNHGGIYLGNGEILHHYRGHLSKTDVASRWLNHVTHYLRYEGPKT